MITIAVNCLSLVYLIATGGFDIGKTRFLFARSPRSNEVFP